MRLLKVGVQVSTLGPGRSGSGTTRLSHRSHCQHLLPNACISKGKLNSSVFVN